MFSFLKYMFWPAVKVRLLYWWWIFKYGGKKKIPQKIVFSQMEKSFRAITENLEKGLQIGRDAMGQEEFRQAIEALDRAHKLEDEFLDMWDKRNHDLTS